MKKVKKNSGSVGLKKLKLTEYQKIYIRRYIPIASVVFLILGTLWIIVSYLTSGKYPLNLGSYNLLVGFAAMVVSMVVLMLWR